MSVGRASWAAAAGAAAALLLAAPWIQTRWREHRIRAAPRPLDVVLLTLDTTRADRLGCYGSKDVATPHLDALARNGARFTRAYSHVPLTGPSHASILTGLTPARHGVHDNGSFSLGEGPVTLSEVFVDAGYRTGAFVSAFVLDHRFGLARGFSTYEDDVLGGARDDIEASIDSSVTVGRALDWLRRDPERPIFLWVHFYDPHQPYQPPEPFASRYKGRDYDGEVAYMDEQVGRLLEGVAARGRPTLIAALGDHGESLGDHGELTHTYFIYSATQHVPFLLSLPGYLPAGETLTPVVRGVDLMPTLLDLAGLAVPDGIDGRSLAPLLTGRSRREPGPAYLESYHPRLWWGAGELLGLRTGPWLFIRSQRPELYQTDEDPGELKNVAHEHPAEMERFQASLQSMLGPGDPLAERQALDAETESRLRALGYVGPVAAAPVAAASLPDAKDNAALLRGHTRASQLMADGKKEEALGVFRETLALNPRSTSVRMSIATLLLDLARPKEAFQVFAEVALEDATNENAVVGSVRCLAAEGRRPEALKALKDALVRFPRSPRLHEELGMLLMGGGSLKEARSELQLALSLDPRQVATRLRYGLALGRLRLYHEAAAELREVVARSPASSEARQALPVLVSLASTLLDAGSFDEARKTYEAAVTAGDTAEATFLNLALATYRTGRREKALETLNAGITAHPASADLRYRRGRVLQELGRPSEAESEFRKALELEPNRPDAVKALAELRPAPVPESP